MYEVLITGGAKTEAHKLALKGLQLAMKSAGINPEDYDVNFEDEEVFAFNGAYSLTTASIQKKSNLKFFVSMPSMWPGPRGNYMVVLNEIQSLGSAK
jgi:hypothetical protein